MTFQPTDRGYDARYGALKDAPTNRVNGSLSADYLHPDDRTLLWVQGIDTGFSLTGSIGQSYRTRTFFPRNRVQQSINVSCQFPNQTLYANAVEWIHEKQATLESSMILHVIAHRMAVKGLASDLYVEGYVKAVPRKHERFVYAPELDFEFLVERVFLPAAWSDHFKPGQSETPRKLATWKDVIEGASQPYVNDPDRKPSDTSNTSKDLPTLTPQTDTVGGATG